MEDFEKQIYSEIEYCHSLLSTNDSVQLRLDLTNLYFLCHILQFHNRPINLKFSLSKLIDTSFFDFYKKYLQDSKNIELINLYISFFKGIYIDTELKSNFKNKFSIEDAKNITSDFFEYFNPQYYDSFENINEDLIVLNPNHYRYREFSGTVLGGYSDYTKPRIVLVDLLDINTCITLAHELSHVADFAINRGLSNQKYKNKLLSMTHEINSYYTELCFYDYLSKQYSHDIELCFKNFDIFFFDFSEYLELLFNSTKSSIIKFLKTYDEYIDTQRDVNGRMIAYILYSLNDIEKSNYICNRIITDIHSISLRDILIKEGINLDDYSTHEKVFKLIKKHWN